MFKSSVKTLNDLRSIYGGRSAPSRVWRMSELSAHMMKYVCIHKAVQLKSKFNTQEPDRPHHDLAAACVIAQQYSSVTLVSLRCHSRKEQLDSH